MKRHSLSFALLCALALLIQSCGTTREITKLQPDREPDKWISGQPLLSDSVYGISYEIGFGEQFDGYYAFDFHITNHSNMALLVNPVDFKYQALDPLDNLKVLEPIAAIDPEIKVFNLEKAVVRNENVSKNQFGIVLLGIGASIAANAIIGTENPSNDGLRYAVTDGIMATSFAVADEARFQSYNLNDLKAAWESGTIRKTTLEPNYSMHGRVFFPTSPEATYINLLVPVDDATLQFKFKQINYPVQ